MKIANTAASGKERKRPLWAIGTMICVGIIMLGMVIFSPRKRRANHE